MGGCPNCQKRGYRSRKCSVCGKEGCEGCSLFLFGVVNKRKARLQNLYVCSQNCSDLLSKRIEAQIPASEIKADGAPAPINLLIENVVFKPAVGIRFNDYVNQEVSRKSPLKISFHPFDDLTEDPNNALWKNLNRYASVIQAKHYETMREFEAAAKIYKELGLYEEAGRVRAKGNEVVIKKTDLSLDLNALLQQIKDGGIVAVCRCPHCGAVLKIGSKTDYGSLRKCEHCGNEIEAMDLTELLKSALS